MFKITKKIVFSLFSLLLVFSIISSPFKISAASFWINAVNNGNGTVTVSVGGNVVGGFNVTAGNAASTMKIMEIGGSGSTTLNTGAGTFTVTVSSISISDASYNVLPNETLTKTVVVTVPDGGGTTPPPSGGGGTTPPPSGGGGTTTPPSNGGNGETSKPDPNKPDPAKADEQSADNTLSNITVSQGTLTPDFKSDITEYQVNVNADIKDITIGAKTTHDKANVAGTGKKELQVGANKFEIISTAENGATKAYYVTVNVDEKPLVYTEYNGEKLGVVRDVSDLVIPGGFTATKVTMEGKEIDAWINENTKQTIVYLISDKGVKNFYLYDSKKGILNVYRPVLIGGRSVVAIDVVKDKQERIGMKFQKEIEIDNQKVPGWTYIDKKNSDFTLHLFLNEEGKEIVYQYDKKEKTLQRNAIKDTTKKEDNSLLLYSLYGAIALVVVLAGGLTFMIVQNSRLNKSLTRRQRSLYSTSTDSVSNVDKQVDSDTMSLKDMK